MGFVGFIEFIGFVAGFREVFEVLRLRGIRIALWQARARLED